MTGQTLKEKLGLLAISYAKIADALGMPAQQLNRIFKQDDIKTGVLERICETQNLPMTFFYPSDGVIVQTNVNRVRARNINTVSGAVGGDAANTEGQNATDETVRALLEQNAQLINILKDKL